MTRIHTGSVAKGKQRLANRRDERRVVPARQVGATDGTGKERVADEQIRGSRRRGGAFDHGKTDAARTMSGGMVRPDLEIPERDDFPDCVETIHGWQRTTLEAQPKHPRLIRRGLVEKRVVLVEMNWRAQSALRDADTSHVIDMGVRQQDVHDADLIARDVVEQTQDLVAWINEHTFTGARARDDEAILEERRNGLRLDYDHVVILAILDDLMFTSKLKTAAKHLGVPLTCARSSATALAEMRANAPALVIVDLNNPRTDPLGVVAAMKADPALAAIPTVGFSHHAETETIAAARRAGMTDVLARGAFFERLPDFLGRVR